jgi:hypothetical protein
MIRKIEIERFSLIASKQFDDVVGAINAGIGHPDMDEFWSSTHKTHSAAELETTIEKERVPDSGSYAPVTVLVDERTDGVHLSYDRMAGLLTPYENPQALEVEDLLRRAAA